VVPEKCYTSNPRPTSPSQSSISAHLALLCFLGSGISYSASVRLRSSLQRPEVSGVANITGPDACCPWNLSLPIPSHIWGLGIRGMYLWRGCADNSRVGLPTPWRRRWLRLSWKKGRIGCGRMWDAVYDLCLGNRFAIRKATLPDCGVGLQCECGPNVVT